MPKRIQVRHATFEVEDTHSPFWDQMSAGRWEATTLDVYERHVDSDTTFLDIGGWIGPTALFAASLAKRVITIEPDPVAASQLRRNLRLNPDLSEKIEVLEMAVTTVPGTVRLGARTGRGDSMSSLLLANSEDSWTVPAILPSTLRDMMEGDKKVFVKIDIEGGEYDVLQHFSALAELTNATFLVAFHPRFLPSGSLWSVQAARLTAQALRPFGDYDFTLVKKKSTRRMPLFSQLNRLGMAMFPVHHSILLERRN